uniref:Uncharacterized protein n=1 Tax=Arundo donax TaxID=35708 RepID=A0A0A8YK61_ARUDO
MRVSIMGFDSATELSIEHCKSIIEHIQLGL